MPTSQSEKVRGLLESFSTAMLITHAGGDELRARPMAIAEVEPSSRVWFITDEDSAKVHEIEQDTRAHLVLQKDHSAYLSISGHASLLRDPARVAAIWKESFRVWFPGGRDDPGIALISFAPERAEYWDNQGGNRIEYLFKAAGAYLAGETPKIDEGDQHGVVSM